MDKTKLYVLFGATGKTGKEILPLLLDTGSYVRVFVRSPEKLNIAHERVEVIKGDISDTELVKNSVQDAYGVISVIGHPLGDRSYKGGMLLPFVKALHEGIKEHRVKHFLIQTGAVSKTKNDSFNILKSILLRQIFSRLSGDHGVHLDNDQVIGYLEDHADDIEWVITRPPGIVDDPSDTRTVVALEKLPMPPKVTVQGLAKYTVNIIEDNDFVHTAKYCGYRK